MNDVIVSVSITTYNHEKFISQALDSVLNQKTNFSFEILLRDDASADGTTEIVNDYANKFPGLIKPLIYAENQFIKGVKPFADNVKRAKGKYIAICEGDDYWTDPYKLQKQVDFLEAHPDYGLVHSDIDILDQETGDVTSAFNKTNHIQIPDGDIFDFLMRPGHFIKTMTVCLRKELLDKYYLSDKQIMTKDWRSIDLSIWLMIARHSKIHYMDDVFATYRLLPESWSRSKTPEKLYQFHQKIHRIRFYYLRKNTVDSSIKQLILKSYYSSLLMDGVSIGNKRILTRGRLGLSSINVQLNFKQSIFYYLYPLLRLIKK